MPEIGATLREARMRQRIDISEIEAQTKIRAKYLRALENEEWELLPGPTFVKSFLRTYAEALGLDARLVLEEYKLRHERPADHELLPIAPPSRRDPRRRRGPSGAGRDVVRAGRGVAVVAQLVVLGSGGDDSRPHTPPTAPARTTTAKQRPASKRTRDRERRGAAAPKVATLRLVPTAPVWVCLRAADGRTLIGGRVVDRDSALPSFRSKRFTMTLGNGNIVLRVNGKALAVPEVQNAIGYSIDGRGKRTVLSPETRPDCAP
jgi:hypothetical protein